jgi:hypothetical protein
VNWPGVHFPFFPRFSSRKTALLIHFFKKNLFSNDVNLKRRLRSSVVRKKIKSHVLVLKQLKLKVELI